VLLVCSRARFSKNGGDSLVEIKRNYEGYRSSEAVLGFVSTHGNIIVTVHGTGKSEVGALPAQRLHREFIDTIQ
jgi:hypothetical protein